MTYRLGAFSDVGLDEALLKLIIDEHKDGKLPRLQRFWTYYRNPLRPVGVGDPRDNTSRGAGSWYRQAQELGLPSRIVGRAGATDTTQGARREVVVENDIAWRIQSMVDFMFAKPVAIRSTAPDPDLRSQIESALDQVWQRSGGIALLQDMALLGHVYGHVDLLVRVETHQPGLDAVRVEVVEPTRGLPLLDPADYRRIAAYIIHYDRQENAHEQQGWLRSISRFTRTPRDPAPTTRRRTGVTEIVSAAARQLYTDQRLTQQESILWSAGRIPIAHIQNISEPFRYEGLGEVEPLIPLQDELNTRLSDRASRVTMQSFKMYLARGIEGFEKSPVGPGMVWSTDNMNASIQEFGGDGQSPSESAHIQEIREAMDKVSGVPPLASGVVRARIGNLTSANALRITLMGLLSKTARKRITYGRGITDCCELILAALDHLGLLRTTPADRGITLAWPDPLPVDDREAAQSAESKLRLGVPRDRVLSELGYAPTDPGVA